MVLFLRSPRGRCCFFTTLVSFLYRRMIKTVLLLSSAFFDFIFLSVLPH